MSKTAYLVVGVLLGAMITGLSITQLPPWALLIFPAGALMAAAMALDYEGK